MKLQVEEIKYRQSFQTLTICVCFADLCWQGWKTAGKRRGRRLDWKRTGCCRAKAPSAKLFYSSVGKRAEFASVQSKVPFAWHFLDNRSLINHWPWILGFLKGQPRAKTTTREREEGERVLCVRELCAILVTQGACVKLWTDSVFFFLKSWLIHSSPGMCLRTCTHTHTWTHTRLVWDKNFQAVTGEDLHQSAESGFCGTVTTAVDTHMGKIHLQSTWLLDLTLLLSVINI